MLCSPKDIVGLRQAARRCRALAAAAEDGFASLSYAQLADEIEAMIAARQAAPGTEFVARPVNMSNHFGLAA